MSADIPSSARFDLKSRNVAFRSRKNVSLFSQSGSGAFGYDARRTIEFAIPSVNLMDPASCTFNFSATINKTSSAGLTTSHYAMFDGTAASVLERVTITAGDGSILEDISEPATLALFLVRAKSESYALNTAAKTLGYVFAVDNDSAVAAGAGARDLAKKQAIVLAAAAASASSENVQTFATTATPLTGDYKDFSIPMSMLSGLFNTDKAFPLGWASTSSGSPALRIRFTLAEPKQALIVCDVNAASPDSGAVFDYTINNPELRYAELAPTDAYSLSLSEAINQAGMNGLTMFYSVAAPWTYTGLQGSSLVLSIPSHEFSIRSLVMVLKPDDAPQFDKFNVSNNASMGINNGLSITAGSYVYPSTPYSWNHVAKNTPAVLYNEALLTLGKLGGEGSIAARTWDVLQLSGAASTADDAHARYYCFNLDSSDNGLFRSSENVINGLDTRTASCNINVRANGTGAYTGNYKAIVYVIADRLCAVTAARGLVAGTAI